MTKAYFFTGSNLNRIQQTTSTTMNLDIRSSFGLRIWHIVAQRSPLSTQKQVYKIIENSVGSLD